MEKGEKRERCLWNEMTPPFLVTVFFFLDPVITVPWLDRSVPCVFLPLALVCSQFPLSCFFFRNDALWRRELPSPVPCITFWVFPIQGQWWKHDNIHDSNYKKESLLTTIFIEAIKVGRSVGYKEAFVQRLSYNLFFWEADVIPFTLAYSWRLS